MFFLVIWLILGYYRLHYGLKNTAIFYFTVILWAISNELASGWNAKSATPGFCYALCTSCCEWIRELSGQVDLVVTSTNHYQQLKKTQKLGSSENSETKLAAVCSSDSWAASKRPRDPDLVAMPGDEQLYTVLLFCQAAILKVKKEAPVVLKLHVFSWCFCISCSYTIWIVAVATWTVWCDTELCVQG